MRRKPVFGTLARLNNASAASNETPFARRPLLGAMAAARGSRRLGHEANDAPDEFLELALNHERKAPLQGFMVAARADTEVKRDMEIRATRSGS